VTRSEPQAECPECGSRQLAREMSVFASSPGGGNGAAQAAGPAPAPRGCGSGCGCHWIGWRLERQSEQL